MKKIKDTYRGLSNSRIARTFLPLFSVALIGLYPALYYFVRNAGVVGFISLGRLLLALLAVIAIIYGVALLFFRKNSIKAANATIIFLFFFHTYGILYETIESALLLRLEHTVILPVFFCAALFFGWQVTKLPKIFSFSFWRNITLLFAGLTVISIIRIIPHEVQKATLRRVIPAQISINVQPVKHDLPDIYYLVFDEFAGFESMRSYFRNPNSETFKAFLLDEGFHVFEESRSSDIWSIHQIATRLNYFDYEYNKRHEEKWLYSIANNKAFAFVESKGYTTVVLEELSWFFPTMPDLRADHVFDIRMFETMLLRALYDDFGMMVVDKTMFYPLNHNKEHIETKYRAVRQFHEFAVSRVQDLQDIQSPKFVYLHILMPHWPYLLDAEGNAVHEKNYKDFSYYEGYYNYTIKVIQSTVNGILGNADPANPPVIILQSDHGARVRELAPSIKDYPEEFQRDILYAMYSPGYDANKLPQDIDPINTLPIVFNHYLNADIPVQ